jgi:hypothetical protein
MPSHTGNTHTWVYLECHPPVPFYLVVAKMNECLIGQVTADAVELAQVHRRNLSQQVVTFSS